MCINYYFKQGKKQINIKPDGYAYIPIDSLLVETGLIATYTTITIKDNKKQEIKRTGDALNILILKLDYLKITNRLDYYITIDNKGNSLNKAFNDLKPIEKSKLYIKFKPILYTN